MTSVKLGHVLVNYLGKREKQCMIFDGAPVHFMRCVTFREKWANWSAVVGHANCKVKLHPHFSFICFVKWNTEKKQGEHLGPEVLTSVLAANLKSTWEMCPVLFFYLNYFLCMHHRTFELCLMQSEDKYQTLIFWLPWGNDVSPSRCFNFFMNWISQKSTIQFISYRFRKQKDLV